MLSIEKSIKEFEAYFQGNHNDVAVVSRTMLKNIEIHKEVNLYDTDWGNYNFKKAVADDPELQICPFTQGRKG